MPGILVLPALRNILSRTQRYFDAGGGSRSTMRQAKESARIARILIKRIEKRIKKK